MAIDVYFYGMTVSSFIQRLQGDFPALDTYGEIAGSWRVPGGEAMNGAMVLAHLGLSCSLGGPWWGSESAPLLETYAKRYGIDTSKITRDMTFLGVRDIVLVDDKHRTVFGWFGSFFSDAKKRWDEPDAASINTARVVAIDPWFNESSLQAARLCDKAGTPYVTIDCRYDSELHRMAAINVVSREFRNREYPGHNEAELFQLYAAAGSGLTVFTSGSGAIRFGRASEPAQTMETFKVKVMSTLGAGDVFRAGMVRGLCMGLNDVQTVRQAAAIAAIACTRMPIGDFPPQAHEIDALLASVPL